MGVGLSPLPLAAARLPPPPLSGPGWATRWARRGTSAYGLAPRACRVQPVLVGPLVVAALVRPLRPLRGLRACAAPGPERFACPAAPARPRWGPSPRCGFGFGAPPAVRGSVVGGPGRGLASSQVCAWGAGGARLRAPARPGGSPLGSRRPPCAPPCSGAPGALWWSGLLPCRPPPGRPRWGLPGARGPFGWASPPARFAVGSPRGARFSRPSPASGPGGGGPPGPAFRRG